MAMEGETRVVASLAEIAGEWDIVAFDGYSPARLDHDGQRHAYVDTDARGLRFSISCNHSSMAGQIDNGVLRSIPDDLGIQTAMGCGPEREQRDETFFRFFREQPKVALAPAGRLHMTTAEHELVLERPAVRRLAMGPPLEEITGQWRVIGFNRFETGEGSGATYMPGRLRITPERLSYSRCPGATVSVTYTSDYRFQRVGGSASTAPITCAGSDPPPTKVEPLLAKLLSQSPEVERVSDGRFVLRSREFSALLTSEADYRRQFE